jgi:hypothetical protein
MGVGLRLACYAAGEIQARAMWVTTKSQSNLRKYQRESSDFAALLTMFGPEDSFPLRGSLRLLRPTS